MYYIIQNFNALKEAAEHRNIQIGEEKTQHTLPILKTSAKSVQTTRVVFQTSAVVCTDYGWSLQKVLRTYKFKYAYLRK